MIKKIGVFLLTLVLMMLLPLHTFATDVNKTLLTRAINNQYVNSTRQVLVLTESDYTVGSWETYFDTIDAAKVGEDSVTITQEEVDALVTQVSTDRGSLVFEGKAALDAAKAAAVLTQSDYTVGTWSALTTALALPETNQSQIVAKTTDINNAIAALVFAGQAALDSATTAAGLLLQSDYTSNSWTILTNALAMSESTQANVLTKTDAINSAIGALAFAGQEALDAAEDAAAALTSTDYTVGTWGTLTTALAMSESTQAQIVAQTNAINSAIGALIFAGQAALDSAEAAAALLTESDYTEETWATLTLALGMSESTQLNVVAKTGAINSAIAAKIFAGQATLNTAKGEAALLTEANYTVGTWSALTTALAMSESTQANVVAKTTAITDAMGGLITVYSVLDGAEAAAAALTSTDYTVGTWSALAAALALPETTQEEVVAKTTAIIDAMDHLVFLGQSLLDAALAAAELTESDYTEETWEILEEALELPETTQLEVVAKTDAITEAIDDLVFAGQAALDIAEANAVLTAEDYTPGTWLDLIGALALPESTQAEVVAQTTAINNAIAALVFAGKEGLDTAKLAITALLSTDYTSTSWLAVTDALALTETTQALVVAKTTAINNAIAALVFDGKAALDVSKANAAALTGPHYTVGTWETLTTALALTETTQALILTKTTAINNAILALVFAGQEALDAAEAAAGALTQSDYTVATWSTLATALVMPETTQAEVVAQTSAITDAIAALITRVADTALTAAKAAEDLLIDTDYTDVSWSDVADALALGESTQAEVVAKTSAINNAIAALVIDTNTTALTVLINSQYTSGSNRTSLKLPFGNYTEASWTVYIASINNAQVIEDNINSLQSTVDAAITTINNAKLALVFAGQSALDAIEATAGTLTESDYTVGTWGTLTTALALPETTQEEVVAQTTAISNAIGGLVFIGQATLDAAEANAAALTSTDYTVGTWGTLTTALGMPESTQAQVVAQTTAINNAISALVFAGQAALDTAVSNAGSLTQSDYTVASWTAFTTSMSLTISLPETTNAEIVTKTETINDVVGGLVFAGQANLNVAIAATSTKVQSDYTVGTWGTLTTALALTETTQIEVVAKTTAINNAMGALVFAGQATLDAAEANGGALTQSDYTVGTWTTLATALAMPETTQAQVVAQTTAINNAISALVFAGQAALDTAEDTSEALTQSDYTTASWSTYTTSIGIANALPESTQIEVVDKTTAINNAIGALVFAGQATLDAAEANAATYTQANYTVGTWLTLTTALALPETTQIEVVAQTTAINNAISALVFAGQAALDAAEANGGALTQSDYTSGTWSALATALAMSESTQAQVVAQTTAINNAISALVFAGRAALDTAKATANTKVSDDYSTTSYNALISSLALPETTQAQVVAKTTAINNAMNGLIYLRPIVTITKYTTTRAKISWTAVSGISGYQVYRATSYSGTYYFTNSTRSRYVINTLVRGRTYYYKVRTYKYVNGRLVYGKFSTIQSIRL